MGSAWSDHRYHPCPGSKCPPTNGSIRRGPAGHDKGTCKRCGSRVILNRDDSIAEHGKPRTRQGRLF